MQGSTAGPEEPLALGACSSLALEIFIGGLAAWAITWGYHSPLPSPIRCLTNSSVFRRTSYPDTSATVQTLQREDVNVYLTKGMFNIPAQLGVASAREKAKATAFPVLLPILPDMQ